VKTSVVHMPTRTESEKEHPEHSDFSFSRVLHAHDRPFDPYESGQPEL
jgi:hypothetical protein